MHNRIDSNAIAHYACGMDFQKIVIDLVQTGLTEKQIGQQVGVSQPTMNRIKLGSTKMPRWDTCQKLIDLHRSRCSGNGVGA